MGIERPKNGLRMDSWGRDQPPGGSGTAPLKARHAHKASPVRKLRFGAGSRGTEESEQHSPKRPALWVVRKAGAGDVRQRALDLLFNGKKGEPFGLNFIPSNQLGRTTDRRRVVVLGTREKQYREFLISKGGLSWILDSGSSPVVPGLLPAEYHG